MRVAQEATALSNQTSKTSGTLLISPPQGHFIVTRSTAGRWSSLTTEPLLWWSSSIEPITSISPQVSQIQMGRGIPQYLCLEMHQSRAPLIQSLNRAEPAQSGYHFTFAISWSISSRRSEIFRNH